MTTDHPAGAQAVGIASSSPPTPGEGRSGLDRPSPLSPKLIGVGVDGSSSGRDAVVLATQLARATDAELMLIAVYDEPVLEPVVPTVVGWTSVQKQARTMLAKTRDSLAPGARIAVQTGVLVSRALESVVRRQHRDLLVIGSGHGGTDGEVRLGRSARELLGDLECPLAIAPQGLRDLHKPALERIGVGFDGEPESQAALELAASIAKGADAELDVLVSEQAESPLERSLMAVEDDGAQTRVRVSRGTPSDGLRSLGAEVDLLVIGLSRPRHAGGLSLRRIERKVIAGSPCPLMIVPRSRDDSAI